MQGDYSIRRLGAAQEALAAQGTPDPDAFISAYPATAGRAGELWGRGCEPCREELAPL